jgi:hypothetical protein
MAHLTVTRLAANGQAVATPGREDVIVRLGVIVRGVI